MRRLARLLIAAAFACAAIPTIASAQAAPSPAPFRPLPNVHDAVTHGTAVAGGRRIAYTARAGTILLKDKENDPAASMFYVAYTADRTDARTRPVTFFWNGGPGSSTIWLHMGSFGPVRVDVPNNATQPGAAPTLRNNDATLLDTSDLVFVDAIGTGWSTVVARGKTSDYYGVDEDAKAFSQFIQRWITRNGRWQSPKFLFGESYGTTRAANVANLLQTDGVAVSGIVLLSSALDYNFLPFGNGPGEDLAYIGYLPTEAAVAWYHHKAAGNPPSLPAFLNEVRAFAGGPYAQALLRGDTLDSTTRAQIVAKMHAYTGLSPAYIEAANLRINPNRFEQELLRAEGRNVGRYDGRYSGPAIDRNAAFVDYDPSDTMTSAAYVAAFNHYAHDVLHYRDDRPYDVLDFKVNQDWKYQRGTDPSAVSVVADLQSVMVQNPSLHVLSANGYFDLATSFYGTEYLLNHLNLSLEQRKRLHYAYFNSGHQVYLNHDALVQFKNELVTFYRTATTAPTRVSRTATTVPGRVARAAVAGTRGVRGAPDARERTQR
ncbi:MAG: peptidase [Candidatus Eremiobacteraeota bacterium]|nr:peptidase [Candidatus Eremiobacteraeota bacterium]